MSFLSYVTGGLSYIIIVKSIFTTWKQLTGLLPKTKLDTLNILHIIYDYCGDWVIDIKLEENKKQCQTSEQQIDPAS